MYNELDEFILNMVHELLFGDFERTGDGRSRLLEYWFDQYRDRVNEIAQNIEDDDEERNQDEDEVEEEEERSDSRESEQGGE